MTEPDVIEVDATGLDCPMPLLKAKLALNTLPPGGRVLVLATDRGSVRDFRVFADRAGHRLLESGESGGVYCYLLEKDSNPGLPCGFRLAVKAVRMGPPRI